MVQVFQRGASSARAEPKRWLMTTIPLFHESGNPAMTPHLVVSLLSCGIRLVAEAIQQFEFP